MSDFPAAPGPSGAHVKPAHQGGAERNDRSGGGVGNVKEGVRPSPNPAGGIKPR